MIDWLAKILDVRREDAENFVTIYTVFFVTAFVAFITMSVISWIT
jgi:hypothetical protein